MAKSPGRRGPSGKELRARLKQPLAGGQSVPPDPLAPNLMRSMLTRVGLILLAVWVVAGLLSVVWPGATYILLGIAGVLTLVEDARAGTIPLDMIERATRLVQYHLDEAVRIIGTTSPGQPIEHAEAMIQWCRRTKREWLYSTDVLRNGPNAIRTRDACLVAMKQLQDAGWVEPEQHHVLLDGKLRARAWPIRQEALAVWARSPIS